MFLLEDRAIIEISGLDRKNFLQSLITNDLNLIASQKLIYSAFLMANGRFFTDFFIFEKNNKYFLDCHNLCVEAIIKKLNLYKLRSNVEVNQNQDLKVVFGEENLAQNLIFKDPRSLDFGYRIYISSKELESFSLNSCVQYHHHRIEFQIPEGYYDLTADKSFIAEFGFDELSAVSYNKGCYIGQEVTARNHYKGQVRKKIISFKINNISKKLFDFINLNSLQIVDDFLLLVNLKDCKIIQDSKEIGVTLSAIYNKKNALLYGLSLVKDIDIFTKQISVGDFYDSSKQSVFENFGFNNFTFEENNFLVS